METLQLQSGRTYQLEAKEYTLLGDTHYSDGSIIGVPGTKLLGTQRLYLRSDLLQAVTTIQNITISGPQLYIDRLGGMNENIKIDNNVFSKGSGIETRSGLKNSQITNNLFQDHLGHPIYGDSGYDNLLIANNEFINCRGGTHLDGPLTASSRNLTFEQNYISGWSAISLELQTKAFNVVVQDNYWTSPKVMNPADLATISAPLDASTFIRIRRNFFGANQNIVWQIEGGGDDAVYEDNYFEITSSPNAKNAVIVTDNRNSWNVICQNNRMPTGLKIAANNTQGTLTQKNNGPDVQLSWDTHRSPAKRNQRLGTTGSSLQAQLDAVIKERDAVKLKLNDYKAWLANAPKE